MPRYTDEDVARWYARYQDGLTLKELAREFGVATPTIQGAFLRRRLPVRPAWRRTAGAVRRPEMPAVLPAEKPPGIAERDWRVLQARRAGRTLAAIAGELGVTRQRVAQIEARALDRLARRQPTAQE